MKGRLPTILSATALLVAVAAVTPIGQAARDKITPRARFALNSDRVDGIHASRLPKAGRLLALGSTKKFPASVFSGLSGLEIVPVVTAQDSSSPKVAVVNCPAGKRVVGAAYRLTGTAANNGDVEITEMYPSTASQLTVRAIEQDAVGTSWMLTAQAFCVAGT
ncbi:MAG TPA: hypothetical protein VH420_01080 [Gaiellaceae bacterium]|jgi:hypothetical protein